MSITSSWMKSLHRSVITHFLSQELSVPWEVDREVDGEKVSISPVTGKVRRLAKNNHICKFKVIFVCTISSTGLYDVSEVAGEVAALLLEPIPVGDLCASPSDKEVEALMFDWTHGYKQARMEQEYTIRLRG